MLKRGLSFLLAIILVVLSCPAAFAEKATENVKPSRRSVEEILAEGRVKMLEVQKEESNAYMVQGESSTSEMNAKKRSIKTATINELKNEGYEAYDVNPSSYDAVQTELKTNLEEIGLTPDGSYIIVVSGEEGQGGDSTNVQVPVGGGNYDTSFKFTYNGVTHIMRYLTVEPYEDRYCTQVSSAKILHSSQPDIVENCLNAIVNIAIGSTGSVGVVIGSILTICDIKLIHLDSSKETDIVLHAKTEWTRVHTQIYDAGYEQWFSWSTVDRATLTSYLTGSCFNIDTRKFENINSDYRVEYLYSEYYYDYQWRKSSAARGWSFGTRYRDYLGHIYYCVDRKIIITHNECAS